MLWECGTQKCHPSFFLPGESAGSLSLFRVLLASRRSTAAIAIQNVKNNSIVFRPFSARFLEYFPLKSVSVHYFLICFFSFPLISYPVPLLRQRMAMSEISDSCISLAQSYS